MKMIRTPRSLSTLKGVALAVLATAAVASSQGQDERGKQLYTNCVACHGADGTGNKLLNAPSLTDLSEKYIHAQLKKFKEGHRGADPKDTAGLQMAPMTQTLTSEADIEAVAKYVASLEKKPVATTLTGGDPEKGKILYATCQACHGADGSGNDLLNAPSMLGQHDWYLKVQLEKFKAGIRGSNPADITGSQMRPMAMMLADEQAILDVVAYIESFNK